MPSLMSGWWRTLEERSDDPAFRDRLADEFPSLLPAFDARADPVARRAFLKLIGASLALGGMAACTRQPAERILPYARQPEEVIPGKPLLFATSMSLGGVATGLLVTSHEGRPTKIDGNPDHPASLGATDIFAQAAVLELYDPDRSQTVTHLGEIRPWSSYLGAIRSAMASQQPRQGAGVRILTESVSSPTLAAQIGDLLGRFPAARWHQWDPASGDNARAGAMLAFGRYVSTHYRIAEADVIVALDADFLASGPGSVRYARDFSSRRQPGHASGMNRLYSAECMPSPTGSRADHRLGIRPSAIDAIARHVAAAVGVPIEAGAAGLDEPARAWADAIAADLLAHRGRSLVVAGDAQPGIVHALAHAANQALGNVGRTVVYTDPVEAQPVDQLQSLRDLVAEMNAGHVEVLLIVGGNPVFSAPPDLQIAGALSKVGFRAHLSLYDDETSQACHWHVPAAHFLESWSDARAFDGTVSIVQPLIAPLYGAKSAHEFLATLSDRPEQSGYEIVRAHWNVGSDDGAWRRWLNDGIVPATALPPIAVTVTSNFGAQAMPPAAVEPGFEIAFRHDPTILDGRFANNGWLQELPKPLTKLTWDNAVLVGPATADRLSARGRVSFQGGEHGQIESTVVELRRGGRVVRGPLFAVAGHPENCATVHLGYGRTRAGRTGTGTGFDGNALRSVDAIWSAGGVEIIVTGDRQPLACTQAHHLMEGRGMVRAITRETFLSDPASLHEDEERRPRTITLYPDVKYEGYKWGMAIDLNACIGCNACVVGCQAENNIPIVGKDEVLRGREMHWIRVDTYYRGPADRPETYFQPVPCMQCENAPCEVVCPVGATVHSDEGLNDMVYNRCVGTRYCSNNCPYKVRRFNFLLYQDWTTPSLALGRNPEVTVRSRGVMEKCTYCVQRIGRARIESKEADRRIRDGEILTACQQACPADAIVFGDLNDPNSRVARLKADVRNYSLLGELNTRPRTTYLAAVRNPNPALKE